MTAAKRMLKPSAELKFVKIEATVTVKVATVVQEGHNRSSHGIGNNKDNTRNTSSTCNVNNMEAALTMIATRTIKTMATKAVRAAVLKSYACIDHPSSLY
jgi:hypothetical protein